ncbi:MAG: amidohydrolase [Marinilabiliaceae bacterium]|nr:amidohydrolase [Marinilabiliaceae bacterium]
MESFIELRHWLHQHPEVSGKEFKTSEKIRDFVNQYDPSAILQLGSTALVVVFDSGMAGKTTMIRAELDALPIIEKSSVAYQSSVKGVGHLCGHDGHMSILAGLAQKLYQQPIQRGKVVLLFQPAEETGQGANEVINEQAFKVVTPDYIFALHNVPGFEKHKILLRDNAFTAASKGMTIQLHGRTSHAAEPENGITPARAVADLIYAFDAISRNGLEDVDEKVLATVIHVELGEIAFGTSPGYAEIRTTLRTQTNAALDLLIRHAERLISNIAKANELQAEISFCEYFPATENDVACNDLIRRVAIENGYATVDLPEPFRWSEDFGFFTQQYTGALLGLGSGLKQPPLHHPGFDFPDDLIETGVNLFEKIIRTINN